MARQDWYDREEEAARRRARLREQEDSRDSLGDDFGQADFSDRYGYDRDGRRGYRIPQAGRDVYDFGQADYSDAYAYDEARRRAYRRQGDDPAYDRYETDRAHEPRSFMERAGDFFSGHRSDDTYEHRPRRPSDRTLWEVIMQRLSRERDLDLRDVDVRVEDREVTLNGRVRNRADKRRVEDIADIDGVRHVQNNLRSREHTHWTFL